MKYNITIILSAQNDLRTIHEYLADFGEDSQKKFRASFDKFIEHISSMPYMFKEYAKKPKYRMAALAYGYIAFYKINKSKRSILIYRVLNSKQNIIDLL